MANSKLGIPLVMVRLWGVDATHVRLLTNKSATRAANDDKLLHQLAHFNVFVGLF